LVRRRVVPPRNAKREAEGHSLSTNLETNPKPDRLSLHCRLIRLADDKDMTEKAFPKKLMTTSSLVHDLRVIGVNQGDCLLVHCSFSKVGPPYGGVQSMIDALQICLSPEGTLVMPTHSTQLTDPANWQNPPAPKEWWPTIRAELPTYDPQRTPTRAMGVLAEVFRRYPDVLRSGHPHGSFSAWGNAANQITAGHEFPGIFGDTSPLARLYELDAKVLLVGVGHGNNTSLHLSEYRADFPKPYHMEGAPLVENGARRWVEGEELKIDSDDFVELGQAFAEETKLQRQGKIGDADALLMPQPALVDFGVDWMSKNRGNK